MVQQYPAHPTRFYSVREQGSDGQDSDIEIYEDHVLAFTTLFEFLRKKRYSVALSVKVAHATGLPYWTVLRLAPNDLVFNEVEKKWKLFVTNPNALKPLILELNDFQLDALKQFFRRKYRPKFYLGLRLIGAAVRKLGLYWDKEQTKLVIGFVVPDEARPLQFSSTVGGS